MLAALASPAAADDPPSLAVTSCPAPSGHRDPPPPRARRGPAGWIVRKTETDLRETVSAGRTVRQASAEPAATQSFGPFNSTDARIAWRLAGGQPFAMIQRWHLADNDDASPDGRPRTRALLVVTRLSPGAVCHVAYVDVAANVDAEALAQRTADTQARGFDCATGRIIVAGTPGRATELALPR